MGFFSEYKEITKLLQEKNQIVFYAESRHYFPYFERLINDILEKGNVRICYITSDKNDPLLNRAPAMMKVVYAKWMLGFLFSRIRADVMIMTMPDLGNYLFKRSAGVGCYIYMFHAAVSTHQQYRSAAFFNYDSIFCTGEYQVKEIRAAEKLYGQKEKTIIRYGYPLFDSIKNKSAERNNTDPAILVAPSWFEGCIFDTCLEEMLQQLASLPYKVILRSHPEYEKRKKKDYRRIHKMTTAYPSFSIDKMSHVVDRLPITDILITDRSGIAFEFAFGAGKPVVFIDTALKKTNPDYEMLGIEPIENFLRSRLGVSLLPDQMDLLPHKISEAKILADDFAREMDDLGKTVFFNSEKAYSEGLNYVLGLCKKD